MPQKPQSLGTFADDSYQGLSASGAEKDHAAVGVNWALEAYARSTEVLLKASSVTDLAEHVCQEIVRHDGYALALVGLLDPLSGEINVIKSAGAAKGYAEGLVLSIDENVPGGQGPTGIALRSRRIQVVEDASTDVHYAGWRERAKKYNIRSSISVPILYEGDVSGILIVYAVEPSAFSELDIDIFIDLARKIKISIDIFKKMKSLTNSSVKWLRSIARLNASCRPHLRDLSRQI